MKPPISYFGSKRRLASWIVATMPAHRVYVEPFAGSAAVLFEKAPCTHEILNDVDGNLVNFFRVLRSRPDDLELACRLSPYARDEWRAADLEDPSIDELERARRWWVLSSQSFGQVAKVNTGWATSIERGSNNSRSVTNRIARFLPAAERLATVAIENNDAVTVIRRYDAPDGVIYCDPPYLGSTRTSINGGRRPNGDYAHEFPDDQHRALAEALHSAQATVIVSGYASELYDEELYPGWHRLEQRVLRRVTNGRSGKNTHVTEVIWMNRPPAGRLLFEERERVSR